MSLDDRVFFALLSLLVAVVTISFQLWIGKDINRDIEEIKNQVQAKFSLKTEERNAALTCYDKYTYWLNTVLEINFSNIEEEIDNTKVVYARLDDAYFQFCISFGRVAVFVENQDLKVSIDKNSDMTLDLMHKSKSLLLKYESAVKRISSLSKRPGITMEYFNEESSKINVEIQDVRDAYNTLINDTYNMIVLENRNFAQILSDHLKAIAMTKT